MTEEVGRKFTRVRHLTMLADKCIETFSTKDELEAVDNSIPTKVSQLDNDSGYLTSDEVNNIVATEGGKIDSIKVNGTTQTIESDKSIDISVPTKTSELSNDSTFTTLDEVNQIVEESGGKIDSIKVNGTTQTIDSNKAIDITVPTKVSALTNDSNYATTTEVNNAVTNGTKITSIKVNGTAQSIAADKSVDITVPTNNNVLTNGAGYQTASQVSTAVTNGTASCVKTITVNGTNVNPTSGTANITTQIQAMIDSSIDSAVTSALNASY